MVGIKITRTQNIDYIIKHVTKLKCAVYMHVCVCVCGKVNCISMIQKANLLCGQSGNDQ